MKYILDAGILQSILANMEPDKRGDYIMKAANFLAANIGTNEWTKHIPKPKSKEAVGEYTQAFEHFWKVYPKKVGKAGAYIVWKKLVKAIYDETILFNACCAALAWQKETEQWKNENGKYIPNPETYLHNGRWEDEPPATQAKRETYMDMNGVIRER